LLKEQEGLQNPIEKTSSLSPEVQPSNVAIFDYLKDIESISQTQFDEFYQELDELSRMLFAMIKNLS
jgi:hypothetical protein